MDLLTWLIVGLIAGVLARAAPDGLGYGVPGAITARPATPVASHPGSITFSPARGLLTRTGRTPA